MAGRLTLVRSVLASIPIHVLAISKIPEHVTNILDRLLRDFLWGSKMGKRLLHWVNWDNCTKSYDEMGLDIRKFQDLHVLFNIKACWNLLQRSSLWSQFCAAKYCIDRNGWYAPVPSFCSTRWKSLMNVMPWVVANSLWQIDKGNSSFWMDKWWDSGIIHNIFQHLPSADLFVKTVDVFFNKDLFEEHVVGDVGDL